MRSNLELLSGNVLRLERPNKDKSNPDAAYERVDQKGGSEPAKVRGG